jgi:hypothetical protein
MNKSGGAQPIPRRSRWPRRRAQAPLVAVTSARHEPITLLLGEDEERGPRVEGEQLIQTLQCGHVAEPLIRIGCRLPYPPRRRRCKKCQEVSS